MVDQTVVTAAELIFRQEVNGAHLLLTGEKSTNVGALMRLGCIGSLSTVHYCVPRPSLDIMAPSESWFSYLELVGGMWLAVEACGGDTR